MECKMTDLNLGDWVSCIILNQDVKYGRISLIQRKQERIRLIVNLLCLKYHWDRH